MTSPTELVFPGLRDLEDLRTYAVRARRADEDGAIRLHATGSTLAAYVGVLDGVGLLGEGAVLGLRAMALAQPETLDLTVSLTSLTDRLARLGPDPVLALPPMTLSTAWAALSPPRAGWERVGVLDADRVNEIASQGISEIAEGVPEDAGGHAVTALRQRVWGRLTDTAPPIPAGGAFAAYVLGFAPPGSEGTVFAHGRWTRLSCNGGHILMR